MTDRSLDGTYAGTYADFAPEPPTPYYERDGITIYLGDCRDVLPTEEWKCPRHGDCHRCFSGHIERGEWPKGEGE